MHLLTSKRGFTLVDLLIAITLLVISGLGLSGSYYYALQLSERSQEMRVAFNDLRDIMERVESTAFVLLTNNFPSGVINGDTGGGNIYAPIVGGYTLQQQQMTVTHLPNDTADPRELVVQVLWVKNGRQYQETVSTMRSSGTI